MSRVSDLLRIAHPTNTKVYTVNPRVSILEAVRIAREKNVGALPVLDEGVLVGIISERDFTRILGERVDPAHVTVQDYMTYNPVCVTPLTDLVDCLGLMEEYRIRHLPVLERGKLVGIVSIRDVLFVLLKNQELLAQQFESYILGMR